VALLGKGTLSIMDEEGKEVLYQAICERLDFTSEVSGITSHYKSPGLWTETSTNHKETRRKRLEREAEIMYKYKFRFKGGGKRVDNMNFKFHCFIADSEAIEHHLFEAKNKGLVVNDQGSTSSTEFADADMYESAMPVVKIFSSTSGFGIPKEYFSFFFLISPGSKKMVKIKPLGYDKSLDTKDWWFMAPGRFMRKEEIRKFFGASTDTWKFYQRQSFISKRRLLEMVEVGDNHNVYDKEVVEDVEEVRMVRLD